MSAKVIRPMISTPKATDLKIILDIYYENSMELLGIDNIEKMIQYDRKIYGEEYKFLNIDNLTKWFKERDGENILAAFIGDKVVGFIVFYPLNKDIGYIEEIHVKKEYRGKGIGSKLLSEAEHRLRLKGVKYIYLEANVYSYKFFYANNYTPIHIEEKIYMNKLQYIDMIKDINKPEEYKKQVLKIINYFKKGRYNEAYTLAEKLINNLPIKNKNILLLLKILAQIHIEDEQTQSYVPLYNKIRVRYIRQIPLFKNLLIAVSNRVLIEGINALGLFNRARDLCFNSLELINEIMIDFIMNRKVKMLEIVNYILEYIQDLAIWFSSYLILLNLILKKNNIKYIGNVMKADILVYVDKYKIHREIDSEIHNIIYSINNILSNFEKIFILEDKIRYTIIHLNFIQLSSNELNPDDIATHIANTLRQYYGIEPDITDGIEISEDIIPEHLRKYINNSKTISIRDIALKSDIGNWNMCCDLEILIFPNNVLGMTFKIHETGYTRDLYRDKQLSSSSVIEYDVIIGKEILKDVELEEIRGNYAPLWFAITKLLGKALNIDYKEIITEPETLLHTIIIIENYRGKPREIFNDIFIKAILSEHQTVYRLPIDHAEYSIDIQGHNIASILGFKQDIIYVSSETTLFVIKSVPLWIQRELTELIILLILQKSMLYYKYIELRELSQRLSEYRFHTEKPLNLEYLTEQIKRIHSTLMSHLSFITSPSPLRYKEYNEVVKNLIIKLNLKDTFNMINNEIHDIINILHFLSAVIQYNEISLMRKFIEEEERSRRTMEYVALIIGVFGLGEIIWDIISSVITQVNPFMQIPLYTILFLGGLYIVFRQRRK